MPRNQTTKQTTATGTAAARVAKTRTSRTTASTHSKASAAEATVMVMEAPHEEVGEIIASLTETPLETISKLAYGYWEERGGQGGDALADWVRAEEEYRLRLTAV
ncbi:MAG: DUF2934 domain-containing protein [Acidobacteriota bacterium]|nr:DUF2934 domain-containing protein [Acidobacteriota bacterium]